MRKANTDGWAQDRGPKVIIGKRIRKKNSKYNDPDPDNDEDPPSIKEPGSKTSIKEKQQSALTSMQPLPPLLTVPINSCINATVEKDDI